MAGKLGPEYTETNNNSSGRGARGGFGSRGPGGRGAGPGGRVRADIVRSEVSLAHLKFICITGTFRIEETLDQLSMFPGPGFLTIDIACNEQRFAELSRNKSGMIFGSEITSRVLPHKHPV